jgi:Protein of unknown function (DUF3775)
MEYFVMKKSVNDVSQSSSQPFSAVAAQAIAMARAMNRARYGRRSSLRPPEEDRSNCLGERIALPRLFGNRSRQLREFLIGQPAGVVYLLITVMYLGRGDFGVRGVREQIKELKRALAQPDWAVRQMLEKTPLPEYLERGLKMLRGAWVDVDKISLSD